MPLFGSCQGETARHGNEQIVYSSSLTKKRKELEKRLPNVSMTINNTTRNDKIIVVICLLSDKLVENERTNE